MTAIFRYYNQIGSDSTGAAHGIAKAPADGDSGAVPIAVLADVQTPEGAAWMSVEASVAHTLGVYDQKAIAEGNLGSTEPRYTMIVPASTSSNDWSWTRIPVDGVTVRILS